MDSYTFSSPSGDPWAHVTTGLITNLPETRGGFTAIATFVDRFGKAVPFARCKASCSAQEYAESLASNQL
ncbi:hypothetical protein BGW42_002511 [Actinomortierella wolfii]|nr:hypothetical protein BGW42_002511 [Actinomortierella wolfii]